MVTQNIPAYQMIPFELKGDLQKFEDHCMPFFESMGIAREAAMVIISSVWLFVNDQWRLPEGIDKSSAFVKQLETLINMNSMENDSNTPDFILAQYLKGSLDLFTGAVNARSNWYSDSLIGGESDDIQPSMEEAFANMNTLPDPSFNP